MARNRIGHSEPEDRTTPLPQRNVAGHSLAANRRLAPAIMRDFLPAQPTSLIGRQKELVGLKDLLHRDDVRLITLTGAPGIGKTRLALEVASDLLDEFADGAYFVDLAPIRDPALIVHAIARAVGVREAGSEPLLKRLVRSLRARDLLLVLDNFEHLLSGAGHLAELLSGTTRLKVLVTSRAPLQLRWEHQSPVPPLELPDLDRFTASDDPARYSAVALFVARARAVKPDFAVTPMNARAVAELCTRLDGLPLAIELAAAYASVLTPDTMLLKMHQQLTHLQAKERDRLPRHRSLRDCIAWSYALLDEATQTLLRRLSVFAGGWTLDAAEVVCQTASDRSIDVLDGLSSLADKSLIIRQVQSEGDPRFRILVTIKEFAHDRLLESGEAEVIKRQHAAYYAALAEQAEPNLFGPGQVAWLDLLEFELDNLRAALAWCTGPGGDLEIGMQLGGGLWHFWDMRDHFYEGRTWCNRLLALKPELSPQRCSILIAAYFLALLQGDYPAAREAIEECMNQALELENERLIVYSYVGMGTITYVLGDSGRGTEFLEEAVRRSRQAGENRTLYPALYWLGDVAQSQNRLEDAVKLMEESLTMARAHGDIWMQASVLSRLGQVLFKHGEYSRAIVVLREGLTLAKSLALFMFVALGLEGLAWVASAQGDGERAGRLLGASQALFERVGAALLTLWQADHERATTAARDQIGADAFAHAVAEGRAMQVDQAVSYACSDTPTTQEPFGSLTRREREVATLIAQGLTNREIAAALVITEGTAANHVQHILNKLGFNTRAQVAAWATERRAPSKTSGGHLASL